MKLASEQHLLKSSGVLHGYGSYQTLFTGDQSLSYAIPETFIKFCFETTGTERGKAREREREKQRQRVELTGERERD